MKFFTKKSIYAFLFFISLSIFFYILAYSKTNSTIESSILNQVKINHENIKSTINEFETYKYNLLHTISSEDSIKDIFISKKQDGAKKVFLSFSKSDNLILQMRVLDLDGNELLRLDSKGKEYIFIKNEALQNKGHRDYFKNFSTLAKDKMGISKLDLNIENNIIEKPFKSTVRLAIPIYHKDKKLGIVIINYNMNIFLTNLFESSVFDIYLVDEEQYIIYHPKKGLIWTKYTDEKKSLMDYLDKKVLDRLYRKDISFWNSAFKVLYLNKENTSLNEFLEESILIGVLILFGSIFLIIPFVYMISSYIKKVNILNESINESKVKIESILNHTSDSIILIDSKGIIKEINLSTEKTFGYEKSELLDKNINILVPEPHHSKHDDYIKHHDRDMHSKVINIDRELFGLHKDGSYVPISLTVTKVNISNKDYFIGTIKNLSNEIKSKKLFENVFASSSMGIAIVLEDGSFWRLNEKFANIVEYSNGELKKLTFQDITHKDDLEKDLALVNSILKKEIDEYSTEKRYITKSGKVIWVSLGVKGIYEDEAKNNFEYFIATIEDITDQVNTKNKLEEAERIAHIGHWFWDIKADDLVWSENMLSIFGMTQEEFNNNYNSFINTVHKDDRELVNKAVEKTFEDRKDFDLNYRIVVDDEVKHIHAKGRLSYLEDEPYEFFGTCQDITDVVQQKDEEKKREVILMEQSKLASMGEMVGAIAHQWRQPLNSIGFILQDLISAYKHGEFDEEYLQDVKKEMMEQLNFMSDTIDQFRTYFKNDEPHSEFNIIRCVEDVNKLYRAQLRNHHLRLILLVDGKKYEELLKDEIDTFTIVNQEAQLKQVLINCISNAKDAILEQKDIKKEQKDIIVDIVEQKEAIEISISDLAGGISSGDLVRAFEPYFTTKNMGTGLGLYICRMICEKSLNGRIRYNYNNSIIDGEKYRGSRFTITLPKVISTDYSI